MNIFKKTGIKKCAALLIISMAFAPLWSQAVTKVRTNPGYVNITKDPPKPPYIEIVPGSLSFLDNDGNQTINANESTRIIFQVKNSGMGPGLNLVAGIAEKNGVPGLNFPQSKTIGTLQPGNTASVEIPVTGTMQTAGLKASFSISVNEANGFGTDPVVIEIPVKEFIAPLVKVVDYKITSQFGAMIEKKKSFEVQVLVQNVGQGMAENITISIPVPENMFCLSDNSSFLIDKLAPGDKKLVEYSFVANNNFTLNEIKLTFQLKERFDKYAENRDITIAMNQPVTSERLVVTGKAEESKKIEIGSLTSLVDKNIPISNIKKPDRIALIIGNEDYSGGLNAEINVDYAVNDANIFRQYAINTMGVPENNMYFLVNATAGVMRKEIERVALLLEKMGPSSELIFYYAGHGLPEESTRTPYLIPVDVNSANLSSAIKLSEVYARFGNSGAARVTVFLDACFSGGGRNQGLLAARGVRIAPGEEQITGNMVVFSASSGQQSALPLHREKHGLFTYYLLKKLQETGGNVSYGDLAGSVKQSVSVESLREIGKEQDPEVRVSPSLNDSWKTWLLR